MRRGELWWIEHPELGRRPACVITRDAAVPVLAKLTVVPATGRVRGIPTEVTLTREDGVGRECVLSLDNITTLSKSSLVGYIATLSPVRQAQLCAALRLAVDC